MNIQQEKHKLVQGRQGIGGTRRLSSRWPSAVELEDHVILMKTNYNIG